VEAKAIANRIPQINGRQINRPDQWWS